MIIKALADHYDYLDHEICNLDFELRRPDLIIDIDENGHPFNYVILDKKAREVKVPNETGRTINIIGELLYDKSKYVFGCEIGKASEKIFVKEPMSFRERNLDLIASVSTPTAEAFRRFLEIPLDDVSLQIFIQNLKEDKNTKGNTIFFRFNGRFIQDDDQIWEAVCKYQELERTRETIDEPKMLSLISGEEECIAKTHPKIKGISQNAGSLISYNYKAYTEGYRTGRQQSINSQIGKTDALKYTKVLNYLIKNQSLRVGDLTIIPFSALPKADDIFLKTLSPFLENDQHRNKDEKATVADYDSEIYEIVKRIVEGKPLDQEMLEMYDTPFYILGLSVAVVSRFTVDFFYEGTFGEAIQNISEYYQRTALKDVYGQTRYLYPTKTYLLMSKGPLISTDNPKLSRGKNMAAESKRLSKNTQCEIFRSVLTGQRYPQTLFKRIVSSMSYPYRYEDKILQRLSNERVLAKLQFIKAYLKRNTSIFQGEDIVSLNQEIKNPAYLMGRVFAIIESTERTQKGETSPYRKYYKKAKSCPAAAHSLMMDKMRMRLSHDNDKKAIYINAMKQIGEILDYFEEGELPVRLSLIEQGTWELGYHQQLNFNVELARQRKEAKSRDKEKGEKNV